MELLKQYNVAVRTSLIISDGGDRVKKFAAQDSLLVTPD